MDQAQRAFLEFERAGWAEVADAYASTGAVATAPVSTVLVEIAEVEPGEQIVEIACGPGYGLEAAIGRGARVIGVDISPTMVELASARCPGADVRVGDAEALPIDDRSAHVMLCAFGLPHFAAPSKVLSEARRVLVPGGRLVMSTWLPPDQNAFFGVVLGSIAEAGDMSVAASLPTGPDMFAFADPSVAEAELSAAGFGAVDVTRHDLAYPMGDAIAELEAFYRGGSVRSRALFAGQTPDAQRSILAEAARRLDAYRTPDGYEVPPEYVVITATAA